jgi:1-acyl-sn-glycerol-3-phosphate acyltransferase
VRVARLSLRLFFRQVTVVNAENFPPSGPVIVVANHANQFVDAMVLLSSVPHRRPVSFMIAEKSLHRPIVGDAAQGVRAVGVVRAQDEKAGGRAPCCSFTCLPCWLCPSASWAAGGETAIVSSSPSFSRPSPPASSLRSTARQAS